MIHIIHAAADFAPGDIIAPKTHGGWVSVSFFLYINYCEFLKNLFLEEFRYMNTAQCSSYSLKVTKTT